MVKYLPTALSVMACMSLLLLAGDLHGQTRVNVWARTAARWQMTDKLSTELELQIRRQEDNGGEQMEYPLMHSARAYLHYDMNPKLRLSLSPVAVFEHFTLRTDGYISKAYEHRSAIAAVWTEDICRDVKFFIRPAVEYRVFASNKAQLRPRLQAGIKWQALKWMAVKPYEEIMAGYTMEEGDIGCDQNRLGAGLMIAAGKRIQLEPGYLHISRSNTSEENIFLHLYYNMGQ
jgi:hypothetical protein